MSDRRTWRAAWRRRPTTRSRRFAAALLALAALVAGWLLLGGRQDDPAPTDRAARGDITWERQGVDQFAETTARDDVVVINVHVPDEGGIADTDLDIAYNRIRDDRRLPTDLDAPIAVYCRTGRMSEIAARVLVGEGYTGVIELRGGMVAWKTAGRPLTKPR